MKSAFLLLLFTFESSNAANSTALYLRGLIQKSFETKIKEPTETSNAYTIESYINNDQKINVFISPKDQKYASLNTVDSLKNKKIQTISLKKNQTEIPSHITINIMNN